MKVGDEKRSYYKKHTLLFLHAQIHPTLLPLLVGGPEHIERNFMKLAKQFKEDDDDDE